MIPYDDLVVALQTWRAKQGLPVGQLSGALTPPAQVAAVTAPASTPGSGPRPAPPAPPSRPAQPFLSNVATPPPLAPLSEESLDVDESALIEESHYENEGDDFAMAFGSAGPGAPVDHDAESTAIGNAPAPRTSDTYQSTDPGGTVADPPIKPKHNRNDDW